MPGLQLIAPRLAGLRARLADRRGAVAMIFGMSVVPLAMAVGLASDYSFYVKVQSQLNLAADTAAMQAVRVASEVSSINSNGTSMSSADYQTAVQTAGQQAGQQWFQAQMANLINGVVPVGNIVVNVTYNPAGSRFTSNVSYTGTVPTNFGALFHVAKFNIGGASSAVISNAFVEVLMLLDNSGSMLIPSTSAGIAQMENITPCSTQGIDGGHAMTDLRGTGWWWNWAYKANYGYDYNLNSPPPASPVSGNCDPTYTGDKTACSYAPVMQNINSSDTWFCTNNGGYKYTNKKGQVYYLVQAPCAFACHSDPKSNDFYGLATNAGIELRLDVVQKAVAGVIQTLSDKQQPNQFSVGVYAFNHDLAPVWPSSGEATTDLTTTQSKTQTLPTPVTPPAIAPNPIGNTDFKTSMNSLNQNVTSAGDGTTPTTPLKNLFIITDGIDDPNNDPAIGPMTSATNEQTCSLFWAKGFNVYVLYTPYLPLPAVRYQSVVMQYSEPATTGATAANVAALQACARYPSHFYVASDPAAINTAMQTMLASALNSPGRVSK